MSGGFVVFGGGSSTGGTGGGTTSWKAPVANKAALPASGNTSGDAIVTLDTQTIYVWNGTLWVLAGVSPFTDRKSLTLDGVTKCINLGTTNFTYDISSVFSVSFWFNASSNTGGGLFTKMTSGLVGLEMFWNTGIVDFGLFGNGTTIYIQNSVALSTGTWYHIVFTYDGTNATGMRMYVNGSARTAPVQGNTKSGSIATTAPASIGSRNASTSYFNGLVDEYSMYNSVLTSTQVTELYNSGTPADVTKTSFAANCTNWYKLGDAPDTTTTIYDQIGTVNGAPQNVVMADFTTNVA